MNGKARTVMQDLKAAASKYDKVRTDKEVKRENEENRSMVIEKGSNRSQSRRERKIALQQDVDKLKKKLRHEENVHRALERAFTRPLGALPRLPSYLPSQTLELLAEVAVLEEEVIRLERQVMNFRKGLYLESIYFSSSSKKTKENGSDSSDICSVYSRPQSMKTSKPVKLHANSQNFKAPIMSKPSPSTLRCSSKPEQKVPFSNPPSNGKHIPKKLGSSSALIDDWRGKEIRLKATTTIRNFEQSMAKKISNTKASTLDLRQMRRLLLKRLASVYLTQLTHQQKLAFWINIFYSCMMNAFLEQGVPSTPEMLIALMMPRAMVNVCGHLLNAMTIYHFIVRFPYNLKHFSLGGQKEDNMTVM